MKRLLIICLFFISGCVGNILEHKTYDAEGNLLSKTEVKNLNGFVNTETGVLAFSIKDGQFEVVVIMLERKLTDSPESAAAIFDGISNFMTGGASNVVDNLTKGK
jgi:hypothetical protein